MNPEHHNKTIAYIIFGIIVVIALGIYIYFELSAAQSAQTGKSAPVANSQQVILTPEQSAQKAALMAQLSDAKASPMTQQQINAKAALLKQLRAQ